MARTPSSGGGSSLQNNFAATAAPEVTDDSSAGYSVGSRWIDVNNEEIYICVDATEGAAVWVQSSVGTAAEVVFTPAGNLASTDVQNALEELDTEKAAASHTHTASQVTDFDTAVAANSAVAANTAKTGVTDEISNVVEDTTPQLGGNLDLNDKSLDYGGTPAVDQTAIGEILTAHALGATIAVGELVYLGVGGKWLKADASAASTAGGVLVGICLTAGNDTDPTAVLVKGYYRDDSQFNFTVGGAVYISETTGDFTQTAPTTADAVVRVVGFAVSADVIYFSPSSDHITVTG